MHSSISAKMVNKRKKKKMEVYQPYKQHLAHGASYRYLSVNQIMEASGIVLCGA